jgi:hypothetical protein
VRSIKVYRIASPWISLEDRAYFSSDGRVLRKTPAPSAEAILILAVSEEELKELIDSVICCPHCGWHTLSPEKVTTHTESHYLGRIENLGEGKIAVPEKFEGKESVVRARCERCRRLSPVERCGHGLMEKDLPVIVYKIGERTTIDYASLSEARKSIQGGNNEEEKNNHER